MVKLIIVQLKQLEHLHSLTRVVPEQNGSLVIGLAIICTPLLQLKKNCRLPVAAMFNNISIVG
jgi:hypothetical protein